MKFRVYGHVKDSTTGKAVTGTIIKIYLNKEEIQKGKIVENGFYELIAEIDDSRIEEGQQLKLTFESEGYKTQEPLSWQQKGPLIWMLHLKWPLNRIVTGRQLL